MRHSNWKIRLLSIALLCGSSGAVLCAEEPPKPTAGEVRLASGRLVEYVLHFDRNSIQASQRFPDGLIALTSSDVLLRFDLPGIRLVRERVEPSRVTCLGRGRGGEILAGLADGRVCRINPTTLELSEFTKLSGPPAWIGWGRAVGKRPAGLIVVTRPTKPVDRNGWHWDVPYPVVHDLVTQKVFMLEDDRTTFLLDGAGRLWLGADKGEWGGRVTRLDLTTGTIADIAPPPSKEPDRQAFWLGVYGFVELHDGQVWVYGGTAHMGTNEAFITRVDEVKPRSLTEFVPPPRRVVMDLDEEDKAFDAPVFEEEPIDPNRPRLPFTHIIEEKDGLFVLSYSDVFRVDKALKVWKRAGTLSIDYRWGRPDAVGAYPSVRAVHLPVRKGEPTIFATVGNGYVVQEGTRSTSHGIPGQLGASRAEGVEDSSEGILVFQGDDRLPVWKRGAKGWEVASLTPPFESDPANAAPDFEIREGERPLKITAAIPLSDGSLLLATEAGLRVFDPVARKLSKVDIQEPPRPVHAFTQDGLGRLWIGTDKGLRMLDVGRKSLESFDVMPLVWNQRVEALAPDPRHKDGIIAALGPRGVAFVRAFRKP